MRECTNSQNSQNIRKPQINNTTGYLGVTFDKNSEKFKASIKINGKSITLGYYENPSIAHDAYLKSKRVIHIFCTI